LVDALAAPRLTAVRLVSVASQEPQVAPASSALLGLRALRVPQPVSQITAERRGAVAAPAPALQALPGVQMVQALGYHSPMASRSRTRAAAAGKSGAAPQGRRALGGLAAKRPAQPQKAVPLRAAEEPAVVPRDAASPVLGAVVVAASPETGLQASERSRS
jgi:hypothetical protein